MVTLTCICMKPRHVEFRGIIKPYLLQYEFSWFGKFFMDFFTRLSYSLFWNFERRFSNLEAVLYMTMTAAYSESARARSQNNSIIK